MDRRSFIMTLLGGMAAASVGGIAVAEAAQSRPGSMPTPLPAGDDEAILAKAKEELDKTDAEFSQYYYYRRRPRYFVRPRYYVRRRYYRPRYYYRPRRRVYFY